MAEVGRAAKTYETWRHSDAAFAKKVDDVRAALKEGRSSDSVDAVVGRAEDFETFRKRFFGYDTYDHQRQWIDVLEGRKPVEIEGTEFRDRDPRRLLINTPPFHSKALSLDTKVLTVDGWSTIGALQVGDRVIGDDGRPTQVVAKSEVFDKPCFRVVASSGEEFTASEDHLWTVSDGRRGPDGLRFETLTTAEMFERQPERGWVLPGVAPLELPAEPLPVDPYVLGAWLGDGHSADGYLTSADPEVAERFVAAGYPITRTVHRRDTGAAVTYGFGGLFHDLHALGVIGDKRVPEQFFLGSFEQRLELLRGLMDTDGTVSAYGQCSFTNTNEALARAVLYLASSLGERATIKAFQPKLKDRVPALAWRVSWTPRGGEVVPFSLERKASRVGGRLKGAQPSTARLRRIRVEPAERVPTQCIRVDNESHLFLVGDSLIPTHNSQTVTVDYVTWRIANDPNVRIILVSKKASFAEKFLFQIKQRLTSPRFAEFQAAYAPPGGWKPDSAGGTWSKTTMYVAGRTGDHKDPTLEAVGITGQIYGARADLIIVDDAVVLSNASEFDKQVAWLESEAWSRLKNGKLIVIGTRLAPRDMYSELLDDERYLGGESPWTYLRQPMVLEFTEDPQTWRTLWPRSTSPSDASDEPLPDGLYRAWDGPAAAELRATSPARVWSLVYMQMSISEDAAFDPMCIAGSTDGLRRPGPLTAGAAGHPERGKEGLYTIGSMDPAMSGVTFSIVGSVDRANSNIWVENAWARKSPPATYFREHIMEVTEQYDVREWVIEEQGFQGFLSQDPELSRWLAARGIKLVGHYTGARKNDPDFGVASLAPLFGRMHKQVDDKGVERRKDFTRGSNLIHLPRTKESTGLQALVDQLVVWEPGHRGSKFVQDGPMTLWFLVERARVYLGHRLEAGARGQQPQAQMKLPFAMRRHSAGSALPPGLSRRMTYGGVR